MIIWYLKKQNAHPASPSSHTNLSLLHFTLTRRTGIKSRTNANPQLSYFIKSIGSITSVVECFESYRDPNNQQNGQFPKPKMQTPPHNHKFQNASNSPDLSKKPSKRHTSLSPDKGKKHLLFYHQHSLNHCNIEKLLRITSKSNQTQIPKCVKITKFINNQTKSTHF